MERSSSVFSDEVVLTDSPVGMRFSPASHLPRSINLHLSQQNGRKMFSVAQLIGLPQAGHLSVISENAAV
jgi:hypothetical protein